MQRIRGFVDLVFDLVDETSHLVERTHDDVVERSVRRFAPIEPARKVAKVVTGLQGAIAGTVFKSIRGINGVTRDSVGVASDIAELVLGKSLDAPQKQMATPMHSAALGSLSWCTDYLQASLNGFWGDSLHRKRSALATDMTLRHNGHRLAATPDAVAEAFPQATGKVCVFVHGLASTEWLWHLSSAEYYDGDASVSFGSRLNEDLEYTPVYLRYNTGRHISENGRDLSALLDELCQAYPVPIEEIALVGHSMGGLVVRSAATFGREQNAPWVEQLRHVACVGSPHLGAPLEKGVNLLSGMLRGVDAAAAQVPLEILDGRSAGVKDLRYGYTHDEEWLGKDPDAVFANARKNIPLVDGVGYYFCAATMSKDPEHPIGKLFGDMLVRLPSAAGEHSDVTQRIPFCSGKEFAGINHLQLVNHPEIYEVIRDSFAT